MAVKSKVNDWMRAGRQIAWSLLTPERGQTMIESAMVISFVAILAVTILTALGDVTGSALAQVSQAFAGPAGQESIPSDAYLGPRIAD